MTIQFTARHFEARPEMQEFAEESVQRLIESFDGIVSADIVFDQEPHGGGRIVEVILQASGDRFFAKEQSNDFIAGVNACVDKLERQLMKAKEKQLDARHRSPDRDTTPSDGLAE